MPAPSIGPTPVERLVELLRQAIVEGHVDGIALARRGERTDAGFEEAWETALDVMKSERAYPHRTQPRHEWKAAIEAAKSEFRASYLRIDTAFSRWYGVLLRQAADETRFASDGAVFAELVA
jgi:hypothetical protein